LIIPVTVIHPCRRGSLNRIRAVPGFAASFAWGQSALLGRLCIAASLCFLPVAAQSRQIGIDIPVQWVTDIDGSMTLEAFSPCRRVSSIRRSASRHLLLIESTGLRALPAADFDGEARWLQLGPSFIDHFSVFYRPAGSDLPWTHKEFGDHASTRDSDLTIVKAF
jgi:hypothetical protein